MTKAEMRTRITFGLMIAVIGYNFLPVKAPDALMWIVAILCFILAVMTFVKIWPIQPE